jgi:hypothetical protein
MDCSTETARRERSFSFAYKKKKKRSGVVEAGGYVRNPKGCASPGVNPEGFPSGRYIHSLVGSIIGFSYRTKNI